MQVALVKRTVGFMPTTTSLDLADRLITATGRLRRSVRQADALGAQRSVGDEQHSITLSQEAAIGHLTRGGAMTTADLARLEGVRPQSMGLTVQALEDLGLVAKTPDPQDARRSLVILTDAGRESRAQARDRRSGLLAQRLESRLSPDDRDVIDTALRLLDQVIDH